MLLKVQVPAKMIWKVVGPIVPLSLHATPSNALHLLRSSVSAKLVCPAMAAQLNRMILAEISEAPVKLIPEDILNLQIRQDLICSLGPDMEYHEEEEVNQPLKKYKRTLTSNADNMAMKTSQILWMLKNNVATSRVPGTASSAAGILAQLPSTSSQDPDEPFSFLEQLHQKDILRKHLLFLDAAVDRHISEHL